MNQLSTQRRAAVVRALVEGVSVNSTVRMTGVSKPTILKLLADLGTACAAYHDEHVRGLKPVRIQTDEVWSFNYCKQKKVALIGLPDPKQISTSHVERHNLTIRMSMRRFTRLTNAHSKKLENHIHVVAMFLTYYNFCRVHSTLGTSPAVASRLADHVWSVEELIGLLP